ncbi:unnamed protein product [Rotaria sp. Silwood1]|nr:unnamed protein product [Rotaria sp. Silwood1]
MVGIDIIRGKEEEHFLTKAHQDAILKVVRQMRSQLLDRQMNTDVARATSTTTSDPASAQLQELTTITCSQCQTEIPRHLVMIDRGFKSDMLSLLIECIFCQWSGLLNNYQEHLDQSHPNPKCEHCGEQFNSVNKLNEHKVLECQKLTIICVLKDFGCNEQIIRGKKEEHFLTKPHQDAILKVVRQMRSQLLDRHMNTDVARATSTTTSDPASAQLQELNSKISMGSLSDYED